jgi:hypothetical protein
MNEVTISIGGKDRILKATFQNLMDIEKSLGCSVMKFIEPLIKEGKLQPTFEQAANIIFYGLNGNHENRLELRSVQNELAEKGISTYIGVIAEFLAGCLTGSKKNPIAAETSQQK